MITFDGRALDRLVDDELSDSDRRELLRIAGSTPDGWKRVALAFLEDQAFRKALGNSAEMPTDCLPLPKSSDSGGRSRRISRFALAAVLVPLAFALGFAGGAARRASEPTGDSPPRAVGPVAQVEAEPEPIRTVGSIEFTTAESGELPVGSIPLMAGATIDRDWLEGRGDAVPESIRVRLEREGYRVREQRSLMSLDLDDGRRAVVPVDNVRVDYVGTPIY
ncbi:MAG: hypothetical protein SFX72_05040 [Isosphaeraceae bacterium]|nr:hypothetical protein [Isosphaeraceae bacterium]